MDDENDMMKYNVKVKMPFKVFVGEMQFDYGTWTRKIQVYAERLMKDKNLVRLKKENIRKLIEENKRT